MDQALTALANSVRTLMRWPARFLNKVSGGRLKPNHITLVSLLGHFWVLHELIGSHPVSAALLLAFFGLLDSLDGALARLQKSGTPSGVLFDSVSDRAKEVILYIGITLFLWNSYTAGSPDTWLYNQYSLHRVSLDLTPQLWLPLAVCGLSLIVSYIRARGETILQTYSTSKTELNKVFVDGLARYEIRMALIVVGLLTGSTFVVLHILFVLLILTALQRLIRVHQALTHV